MNSCDDRQKYLYIFIASLRISISVNTSTSSRVLRHYTGCNTDVARSRFLILTYLYIPFEEKVTNGVRIQNDLKSEGFQVKKKDILIHFQKKKIGFEEHVPQ